MRDPCHMQGRHTRGPRDRYKEASGFDFEYSSNIQMKLLTLFRAITMSCGTNCII